MEEPLSSSALRWDEAARGHRAGARESAQHSPAGRALRRAGRHDARDHAGRAARADHAGAEARHLRHSQRAGGGLPGRSHRRDVGPPGAHHDGHPGAARTSTRSDGSERHGVRARDPKSARAPDARRRPPIGISMSLKFGIGLLSSDVRATASQARLADDLGYDLVRVADSQCLFRDLYVALTLVALETKRAMIGPGVTNPITRHPTVTAG